MNILNKNYLTIYKKMVLAESNFEKSIESDFSEIRALTVDKDLSLLENELALKYSPVYQKLSEERLLDKLHTVAKKISSESKLSLEEAVRFNKLVELVEGKESYEINLFLSEGYKLSEDCVELTVANKKEIFDNLGRLEVVLEEAVKTKNYHILTAISNL